MVENSILKDTLLQLNILRTWTNIRAKSLIKTSVNIMKQKLMKVSAIRSVAQKSKCALWRTLHLSKPRFTYFIHFFFLSTLDFKFNIFWHFTDLEVYLLPLLFFIKTTKILMKLSDFLEEFQAKNLIIMSLFFTKNPYLLAVKITPDVYDCLWFFMPC